jgi:ABC-2 type transport system permease protein
LQASASVTPWKPCSPDTAILFGKVAAAVVYGFLITVVSLLIGLVTVNIAFGKGQLLLFPGAVAAAMMGVSLILCLLMAAAGVLISLRASTARQAQQTLSAAMLIMISPIFIFPLLSGATQRQVVDFFNRLNPTQAVAVVLGFILLVDVLLILLAMRQFKRARLILD